jgi:hypothetical protein
MGAAKMEVISFEERVRHARASAGSRAAKLVSKSAVTSAARAFSVAKTAAHHSDGILLRWPHLVTAVTGAPTSAAKASREDQSSMIERNEVKSDILTHIGQSVLKHKAILSLDCELPLGHTVRMAKKVLTDFECRFLARTYAARKLKFDTQDEIAPMLQEGMKQDSYKQYEARNILPMELVDRFVKLTGVNHEWLISGRGPGPAWQERYQKLLEKQKKPKRGKRAA